MKSLSETRWECKTEAVKVVHYQLQTVKAAPLSMADTAKGKVAKCKSEAMGLLKEVGTFRFLVRLFICQVRSD